MFFNQWIFMPHVTGGCFFFSTAQFDQAPQKTVNFTNYVFPFKLLV